MWNEKLLARIKYFFCSSSFVSWEFFSASCFILMSIYVYVFTATINFPLNKQHVICKKETGEMRVCYGRLLELEKLKVTEDGDIMVSWCINGEILSYKEGFWTRIYGFVLFNVVWCFWKWIRVCWTDLLDILK